MLLSEVEYARADSVAAAVSLLAGSDNARVLAGGQSLVNVMKQRFAAPDLLVDLNGIEELLQIRVAGGTLEIGAMVTLDMLEGSADVEAARPVVGEVASHIADVQVRNRGTIGGNVCLSDPTNNLPPLLAAIGAEFAIVGAGGARSVSSDDFFVGVYETAVEPGEVLTTVRLPVKARGQGDGWASLGLGKDGTGIVNAAATVTLDGGRIGSARLGIGCVAAVPVRPGEFEARLAGAEATGEGVRAALAGLGASLDPPADVHASSEYRQHVAEVLAVRAVMNAIEEAKGQ